MTESQIEALKDIHRRLAMMLRTNDTSYRGPDVNEIGEKLCDALAVIGEFCDTCSGRGETWRGTCNGCSGKGA